MFSQSFVPLLFCTLDCKSFQNGNSALKPGDIISHDKKISVFASKRLSHLINACEARCLTGTVAAVDPPVPPILGSGHRHQILPLVLLAHFNGGAEVVNRPLVSESLARRRRRRRAPSGAPRPSSGAGRRLLGQMQGMRSSSVIAGGV